MSTVASYAEISKNPDAKALARIRNRGLIRNGRNKLVTVADNNTETINRV
jgi:hypothetical protein